MNNEVINSDISEHFADCTKVRYPGIIMDRITSIKDEKFTHLYVEIWTLSKDYFFEVYPDLDSMEYSTVLNSLDFTSDSGMLLSSIKFDDAQIYYRSESFTGTDKINEYINVAYPSGHVVTFEVIRVAA